MSSTETNPNPRKRPLTEKELAARRANAQKSTGPKTAEGKARSSANATKHGFLTQTALLYYESPEDFVALRDAYIAEYNPSGPTEMHFVMEMANAQYRLRRVRGFEADLIQKLITHDLPARGLSNNLMQAEALRALADNSHVLQLLQRYEIMFRRQYERALRLLWEHRDRARRQQQPHPSSHRTLQALHAFLTAPSPAELAPLPILQNEPEPTLTQEPSTTSAPNPAPACPPAETASLPSREASPPIAPRPASQPSANRRW